MSLIIGEPLILYHMPLSSAPNEPQQEVWQRAYSLFEQALDLPAEARESFAAGRASSDPALLSIVLELIRNASQEEGDAALSPEEPRSGSRIGRYEITSRLGIGGMGHVYAARDTELERMVALKFIGAAAGSSGGNATSRLIHEAKAASALNHPNIVTVYDVVRSGDDVAVAMELVEGEPLRRYCGLQADIGTVIHWVRQIAQALRVTHAHGIIHGDIKPENVMVRPDGYIKVLDFGLARRVRLYRGSAQSSLFGVMAGTLAYLSPEQMRGESPTAASDVFSLGVMLYELVCGRHPFQSASPIDTAYAIAHHDPREPRDVRPELPAAMSALVREMIEKDRALRPTAAQVEERLAALAKPEASPVAGGKPEPRAGGGARFAGEPWRESEPGPRAVSVTKRARGRWIALAAALAGAAVASAWYFTRAPRHSAAHQSQVFRYTIQLPSEHKVEGLVIAPDGSQFVYQASTHGVRNLYRRFFDSEESRLIAGTENGRSPFFSPDGRGLGFFASGKIRIADESGVRDLVALPDAVDQWNAFWASDGNIYFNNADARGPGMWRIPAQGGRAEPFLRSVASERGFRFVVGQQFLGGANPAVLYTAFLSPRERSLQLLDLRSRGVATIVASGEAGHVVASGHLVFYREQSDARSGALMAVPFDEETRQIRGTPVEVLHDVGTSGWGRPMASVAANGTLVWVHRSPLASRRLMWVDRSGRRTPLFSEAHYEQAEVSPDGSRISVVRRDEAERSSLWIVDLRTNAWTRLLESTVPSIRTVWSPRGDAVIAGSETANGDYVNLYRIPLASPSQAERLTEQPDFGQFPMSWSGAANAILYLEGLHPGHESDIMALSLERGARPRALVTTKGWDTAPSFSPDGKWFVYSSNASGSDDLFVQSYPPSGPPIPIEGVHGWQTLWSRDGRSIYYVGKGGDRMELAWSGGHAGPPKRVVPGPFTLAQDRWTRAWSQAPDGRFLVIQGAESDAGASRVEVVLNWFEELKRLAPLR